jgi:hypothetical protein
MHPQKGETVLRVTRTNKRLITKVSQIEKKNFIFVRMLILFRFATFSVEVQT